MHSTAELVEHAQHSSIQQSCMPFGTRMPQVLQTQLQHFVGYHHRSLFLPSKITYTSPSLLHKARLYRADLDYDSCLQTVA